MGRPQKDNDYEVRGDHICLFIDCLGQRYECLIDIPDLERVLGRRWCLNITSNPHTPYAVSGTRPINGTKVQMHRLLADAPDNMSVDHRDGNGLNNRQYNIRVTTSSGNSWNRTRIGVSNTSGYRGVSRYGRYGRYRSRVEYGDKTYERNGFLTIEEAGLDAAIVRAKIDNGTFEERP
jgi:hypothetical protein